MCVCFFLFVRPRYRQRVLVLFSTHGHVNKLFCVLYYNAIINDFINEMKRCARVFFTFVKNEKREQQRQFNINGKKNRKEFISARRIV